MNEVYAIRPPAVAGLFYPSQPEQLLRVVDSLLPDSVAGAGPAALIIPHAGFRYSGYVAGAAWATLGETRWRRVALLGPPHRRPVTTFAVPGVNAFSSPLGEVPLDTDAIDTIRRLHPVVVDDNAHAEEHSLEVHLPFLQRRLGSPLLVPVLVGEATPAQVADLLDTLDDGDTLFVISSDLSHFHPYGDAVELDRQTLELVLSGATDIEGHQACGCRALNGLNEYARRRGWQRRLLAYQNSGDSAGDRDKVVGYGAVMMGPPVEGKC